jgi:CheY-like chemotaxis protein
LGGSSKATHRIKKLISAVKIDFTFMETIAIHVLLVEDSPTDADLFHKMFLRSGRRGDLIQVERLSQAIAACNQQTFNVVLLDLNLPTLTD